MTHKRSYRILGANIIATLMCGPCTWQDMTKRIGMSTATADGWLKSLRGAGVVRVSGFVKAAETTRMTRVYSLQPAPFALPDVQYPRAPRKTPQIDRIRAPKRKLARVPNSVFDLAAALGAS